MHGLLLDAVALGPLYRKYPLTYKVGATQPVQFLTFSAPIHQLLFFTSYKWPR